VLGGQYTRSIPREWLYGLCDVGYHHNATLHEEVDEIYQEEELPTTFVIEPSTRIDDLVGDADDI
jgi:hypothetical protein